MSGKKLPLRRTILHEPRSLWRRATAESGGRRSSAPRASPPAGSQMQLFVPQDDVVIEALRKVDVDSLTPLAALNLLATFKARLGGSAKT
jgi:hypothetical protein